MSARYSAEEKAMLWLDSFPALTFRQKSKLLEERSPLQVAEAFAERREAAEFVPSDVRAAMRDSLRDGEYVRRLLADLERRDIFFVTFLSADYPELLRQIPTAPLLLYCRGRKELLRGDCFSVVGSRKIQPRVQVLTERVTAAIAERMTIVTGFAEGGDESAIRGTMSGRNGEVNLICVLAGGLNRVYPATHGELMRTVGKRGLLISEQLPDVVPRKYHFPVRNRIIAGMSRGTLVVAAGRRSGTAITAGYAAEFGRDVFAFPYRPGEADGEGCNALLKTGAILVESAEDVTGLYGWNAPEKPEIVLTAEEEKVTALLKESGEAHVESLAARLGIPTHALAGILAGLEVKGAVVRTGGNRYAPVG